MLFNSYVFIFVFLPITLAGFYLISKRKIQLSFLLCASLGFYAYWNPKYVFFLVLTVVLDFYVARAIFKTKGTSLLFGEKIHTSGPFYDHQSYDSWIFQIL